MIPKDITREIILDALREIDENGIPKHRLSTKYHLSHDGKLYPPKYVISLAKRIISGEELNADEFSGGDESNTFLAALGFEIRGEQSFFVPQYTKQLTVSTAVIYSNEVVTPSNTDRSRLLAQIIEADINTDIILLPAGYYQSKKINHREVSSLEKSIKKTLQAVGSSSLVCVGVDYRDKIDQVAYAIGLMGIVAAGRKFYATAEERETTVTATDFMSKENGMERTFQVNGFNCYIAVCYDCFGIRKDKIKNPGIDILLDLAHGFHKLGQGSSGDVDFARKGFAGASMQWQIPVFGTGVFFGREVPERWPTGIMWSGAESVKDFKYADNQMQWIEKFEVTGNKENAIVYKYIVKR